MKYKEIELEGNQILILTVLSLLEFASYVYLVYF